MERLKNQRKKEGKVQKRGLNQILNISIGVPTNQKIFNLSSNLIEKNVVAKGSRGLRKYNAPGGYGGDQI